MGSINLKLSDNRWRWIFWGLSIFQSVVVVATLLFLHETNAPILLDWKTKRLRAAGSKDIISPMETGHTAQQIFTKYLLRPFKVWYREAAINGRCLLAIQLWLS
jgi:hypothetical protein